MPFVRLFVRDDLPTVSIDKLAFLQVLHAAKAPPTSGRLVDLQGHRPTMLHDAVLTIALAVAQVVAFVNVMSTLQVERPKTRIVAFARRVGKGLLAFGVTG